MKEKFNEAMDKMKTMSGVMSAYNGQKIEHLCALLLVLDEKRQEEMKELNNTVKELVAKLEPTKVATETVKTTVKK